MKAHGANVNSHICTFWNPLSIIQPTQTCKMDLNNSCKNVTTHTSCAGEYIPLPAAVMYAFTIGLTSVLSIFLNTAHFRTIRSFEDLPMTNRIIFKVHAICDVGLAMSYGFTIPLILSDSWSSRSMYCKISSWFNAMFSIFAIALYGLQHLNRLLSIVMPYRYTACMSNVKIWICTLGTILVSNVMFLSNIPGMGIYQMPAGICYVDQKREGQLSGLLFMIFGVLVPSALIIFVYVWLLTVTYRHAQKIHAQEFAGAPNLHQGQGIFVKIRSIKRALFVTIVTVGWFALTGLLLGIWNILDSNVSHLHYAVAMIAWWMFLCQTFGNMIGLLLKKSYRNSLMNEIQKMILHLRCKSR